MIVNISAVLQKGEITKAVKISGHQKLKEWKIINILFCKDALQDGAKPGYRIWNRSRCQKAPKCSD